MYWVLAFPAAFLLYFMLSMQLTRIEKELRTRQAIQERQLLRIMEHLGVTPDESHLHAARAALANGETIAAIRAYRDATGASLKDAKAAVDQLRLGNKPE